MDSQGKGPCGRERYSGTLYHRRETQRTACRRIRSCHLRTDEANNVVYRLFWEGGAALECSDGFEFDYLPENPSRQGVTQAQAQSQCYRAPSSLV